MLAPAPTNILVATEVADDPVVASVLSTGRKVAGTFYYATNDVAAQSITEARMRVIAQGSDTYRNQTSMRYWYNFITLNKITHLLICDEKRRGKKRPKSISAVLAAAVSTGISITFI